MHNLREQIAKICLLDHENIPLHVRLGMSHLNNDIKTIKKDFSNLKNNIKYDALQNLSLEQYNNLSYQEKRDFTINASIYCLMIKKEYHGDLNNNNKFNNFDLYRNQLFKDLNKVPLLYFTWFNK